MYSLGYLLKTDEDFETAMNFRIIVSITQKGEHMGSGCINAFNEETVRMVSGEFNKAACEFKVVESAMLIYSKKIVSYS
jgi:ribosome maturation factor RimP